MNSIFTAIEWKADKAKLWGGFHLRVSHPLLRDGVLEELAESSQLNRRPRNNGSWRRSGNIRGLQEKPALKPLSPKRRGYPDTLQDRDFKYNIKG